MITNPVLLLPCPNPECDHIPPLQPTGTFTDENEEFFATHFTCRSCGYHSPTAGTEDEAARLHNLLCRSSPAAYEGMNLEHLAELILRHCEQRWGRANEDAEPVLMQEVAAIIRQHSAVSPKAGPQACEWSPQNDWENDSDDRWWNTGCGSEYILNAGNVPGREFSYCPYCGGEASPPAVSVGQEKERE